MQVDQDDHQKCGDAVRQGDVVAGKVEDEQRAADDAQPGDDADASRGVLVGLAVKPAARVPGQFDHGVAPLAVN